MRKTPNNQISLETEKEEERSQNTIEKHSPREYVKVSKILFDLNASA